MKSTTARTASFGPYTLDLRSGELRKFGVRVKMGEQPFQILLMLLETPGELIAREDLRAKLWADETFVDFDHGLNSAVQRLRDCLSDTAEKPLWVETVTRRGYRFVGSVRWSNGDRGFAPVPNRGASDQTTAAVLAPNGGEAVEAPKQRKIGIAAGLVAVLAVLVAAVYGLYSLLIARRPAPFETFTITQVTNNAKTIAAAISPDGKYLLSVLDDRGKQSLWLRHVQTNSDVQVITPDEAYYQNLAFMTDGSYFYFRKANDVARTSYNLLRAPVLGGTPELIVRDVDSAISFSPDGKRIVFVRANNPVAGKFQVLTAKADGTDEKFFSEGTIIEYPQLVSWSPDGKQFASLPPGPGGAISAIQFRNVASAKIEALIPFFRTQLNDLVWLPGRRGVLVTYQGNSKPFGRFQIGFHFGSSPRIRTVTNDTNNYQTLTLSADGKTLATVQQKAVQSLYLLPNTGFVGTVPKPALAQNDDSFFFGWAANGEIYFGDGNDLLQMSLGGKNKKTILSDPTAAVFAVNTCSDGRYVLLDWAGRAGTNKVNIWRVNADGSNPKQLSHGDYDVAAVCASDGKWAYYKDFISFQLMRVPMEGGAPEVVPGLDISKRIFAGPDMTISPDGKRLAFLVGGPENGGPISKIALVPLDAGPNSPVQFLDPDPRISGPAAFTPDGKAVIYPVREYGVDNLWLQPLDGSRRHQITYFQSDTIQNFHFSPDGKTLGVFQQHLESDAVLLHDTGASPR
jgi:DNA-binding winged helix-turn-helix (wHTH) protein/Tol biopolymer transport system component